VSDIPAARSWRSTATASTGCSGRQFSTCRGQFGENPEPVSATILRGRAPREYSSPGGEAEDEWFVDNLIGTINIGASLEDATWDLALRVLPQAWWDRRTAELAAATRAAGPLPAAER
jgi:hypothetical protein